MKYFAGLNGLRSTLRVLNIILSVKFYLHTSFYICKAEFTQVIFFESQIKQIYINFV